MNTLSFMSVNGVVRQLDYHMTGGWMQGETATQAYFRPIETDAGRFDALMAEIVGLGFTAVDIWLAHLHDTWATEEHVRIARETLARHNLTCESEVTGCSVW